MGKFIGIDTELKIDLSQENLGLIYTPGVGASCLKIKEDKQLSFILTNRLNSVAVISEDYEKALKRSIFLKSTLQIDAFPFEINSLEEEDLKLVVNNIEPTFKAIDLSLIENSDKYEYDVEIPVLTSQKVDLKDFFGTISRTLLMTNLDNFSGDLNEKSLQLREYAGGVLELKLTENQHKKPVVIFSDGSAVLGFSNIGAYSALPVMEGKSVLFKALGDVNAIPLCVKTQKPSELIKIMELLENSFSGVNLEDISAPNCFEIEKTLIDKLKIPVFHDDQHGAAIVVLAGLLNATTLCKKRIEDLKIAISGAGAAAQATARLLLKAGVKNIILSDINGIVYEGRPSNDKALENISKITNKEKLQGGLENSIKKADVFIGLSAPNLVNEEMVKSMNEKPIIFALANPNPEIMPDLAKKFGAYIVGTGRSDFENQINNSLAFPGLFKGVLENKIKKITDDIKINCAISIASIINEEELKEDYIIPNALDRRVPLSICQNILN